MIQRLQSNINFKSTQAATAEVLNPTNVETKAENMTTSEQSKEKFSITDTYQKAKKGVTDVFKKINTVTGVTGGSTKGLVEGGIAAATISVLGKNIKMADGKIWGTIKGIGTDLGKVIKTVPKTIKAIFVKSPLENFKSLASATGSGIKNVYRGIGKHKLTAALAATAGLAIFAFRTIQGKVNANQKNANLDHKTNQGHV